MAYFDLSKLNLF